MNCRLRSLTLVVILLCLSLIPELKAIPQADSPGASGTADVNYAAIPGPLRSFLRMAGISQKVSPDEVLPLLSYNVFQRGYEGWQDSRRPVEFLILLERYVHQARELSAIAGPDQVIRVSNCEQGKQLLHTLGYRLRDDCGNPHAAAVTSDAERAFLTIDSGFPLLDLEEALQKNQPFSYAYPVSRVPVIFTEADWKAAAGRKATDAGGDLVDIILHDPALARLYWSISRMDHETRLTLQRTTGLRSLVPYGPVLDFYGGQICIRSGRVLVPGGVQAAPLWKELAGVSPDKPGEFSYTLLSKDMGWLAAYFDAMSRISTAQQAHFISGHRLTRDYDAFRSPRSGADAARQAFRPAPGLLLLLTRLPWGESGEPPVPGDLEAWKKILRQKTESPMVRNWERHNWKINNPDQLLETMFALSRADTDTSPLQLYLLLSELDARRTAANRLHPETVLLLASRFSDFKDQYRLFLEFPELNDKSIVRFVTVADEVDRVPDHTVRGNTMGIFQANIGLWQVLARQGQIPGSAMNKSWQEMIEPFSNISSSAQLFDSGRSSLASLLRTASGQSNRSQAEIIDLLAGPVQLSPDGQKMHQEIASNIQAVLDGQRLISLDTLQALGNDLDEIAKGKAIDDEFRHRAGQLREFEMPQPIFTGTERAEWASGVYNNRHTDLQMRTDLTKTIKSQASAGQLQAARGQLSPFLRDFLVGLNYAYYQPPGAQVLRHNPLFVRSHDFAGDTLLGNEKLWQAPRLIGEGTPAGGGAHFVGSLADLPYSLASVEEDFLAPDNVQALIWKELVPSLLVSSTVPRWWGVSREELHAVALQQKAGEELVIAATGNAELRNRVEAIFAERVNAYRLAQVEYALDSGKSAEALARLTPADTFYLTSEYRLRFPDDRESWGPAGQELSELYRKSANEIDSQRMSRHFGVPHPTLAQNDGPELLNVRPFPAFEGYSSRLLAETWDSGNLYWARLADEMGYSPVILNQLAPELTRRMVEKIFATDFEDWDALLRAMRETGDEFRQGKVAAVPTTMTAHP